jgi:lipoic acid synthetase
LRLPAGATFGQTRNLLARLQLHTVCESAQCPNHWDCWDRGTATFLIAGDRCTRRCLFCAVAKGQPFPLDSNEPQRVAQAAHRLNLRHVVLTSVSRDDLPDGGAGHFRRTIEAVRAANPGAAIEVLVPDFLGQKSAIDTVLAARPDIFNHNLETVRRLTPVIRSRADYDRSLGVLRLAKDMLGGAIHTKSGLMLGLGETEAELFEALGDLRAADCDLLTLGQYLQPTPNQLPVAKFIGPDQFERYGREARWRGFLGVFSGPMVRSSYHAESFSPRSRPGFKHVHTL